MPNFFSAKKIDESLQKNTEKYIDKFRHKDYRDLVDRDTFNNFYICPLCRKCFPDHCYFLRHYRFKKNKWELRLLERIYEYGPRQLNVFDTFYEKDGLDAELSAKIRFWVLCLKILEALNPMPLYKTTSELNTKSYINKIFKKKFWKRKEEKQTKLKIVRFL
jgi:hypothetical protein